MTSHARAAAYGILSHETLAQIVEAHERYARGEAGGRRAVFKFVQLGRVNLSARILDDADFTAAAMAETQLIRASLKRANFFGADLTLADLRAADCSRADFRGAVLRGSNLAHANLEEADMRRAVLAVYDPVQGGLKYWRAGQGDRTRANVSGSNLNAALLDEAEASGADFSHCSLKNARLNGANLKGAVFRGAVMSGAQFKGAVLADVDLRGAVLTGVDVAGLNLPPEALEDCLCDPSADAVARRPILIARLNETAAWVDSNGSRGKPAVFDNEDLRVLGDMLAGRTLPALIARRATAVGMNFAGAKLPGANFEDCDLRDANFSGADVRGASFRNARLNFARFDGADVGSLPLGPDRRLEAVFDGADLTGARFDAAA